MQGLQESPVQPTLRTRTVAQTLLGTFSCNAYADFKAEQERGGSTAEGSISSCSPLATDRSEALIVKARSVCKGFLESYLDPGEAGSEQGPK